MVTNATLVQRLGSALFYALASALITVVNKIVLTSYGFPSAKILAIGQLITSIVVLYLARIFKLIDIPRFSFDILRKTMPLPVFFFVNLLCGLGGTKAVSLPMFTALRRFSIWMSMISEQFILHIKQPILSQASVYLMVIGALIASSDDLTFNLEGYSYLMVNNIATAVQGVVIKQKLVTKNFNQYSLLFYNSMITVIPAILLTLYLEDMTEIWNYQGYSDPSFILFFLLSSLMGFLLNYSTMLCTNYNSPLTTAVVGGCKNIFVTYIGMFIGGDYVFSFVNFLGLNLSAVGSALYSWLTFSQKSPIESKKVQ